MQKQVIIKSQKLNIVVKLMIGNADAAN